MIHGRRDSALYIHIPFCLRKCLYCDFTSHVPAPGEMEAYAALLVAEIDRARAEWPTFRPDTVFLGGGTPSLLPATLLGPLMDAVGRLGLPADAEITLEANPGTLETSTGGSARPPEWRAMGFNRVSMGVQAVQDRLLSAMGRMHRHADTVRGLELLRGSGFENINLDLMFGLPGQTAREWAESLDFAAEAGVPHLSCYSLQIEEGTPWGDQFEQGRLKLPEEESDRTMYRMAVERMAASGLERYEISNLAKHGWECRHNLVYWNRGNYLGIGCAAHSFMDGRRFGNTNDAAAWAEGIRSGRPVLTDEEDVDAAEALRETVMLGIRLRKGLSVPDLIREFGDAAVAPLIPGLERLEAERLLERCGETWRLCGRGWDLANVVISMLIG